MSHGAFSALAANSIIYITNASDQSLTISLCVPAAAAAIEYKGCVYVCVLLVCECARWIAERRLVLNAR